ncbi:GGDEF domain-containing protein [Caldicellulosiruptor naganoensis]|uniref:GGDEF domain-containing protein n=2 Tax=Caldicellulosiruptor naganoensis TaxID=29324 RepID=A0ABY7BMG1_9FIRM|nr:GGDEF domain-containing protein [Caldicellulosiruptor naganoensis]
MVKFYLYKSFEIVGLVAITGIFIISLTLGNELKNTLLYNFGKIFLSLTALKFIYVLSLSREVIDNVDSLQGMAFLNLFIKLLIVYSLIFSSLFGERIKYVLARYSIPINIILVLFGLWALESINNSKEQLFLTSPTVGIILYKFCRILVIIGIIISVVLFITNANLRQLKSLKVFLILFAISEGILPAAKRSGIVFVEVVQNLAFLYLFIAIFLNITLRQFRFLRQLSMFSREVLEEKLDLKKSFDLLVDFIYEIYSKIFSKICFYYCQDQDNFILVTTKGEDDKKVDKKERKLKVNREYFDMAKNIQVLSISRLNEIGEFENDKNFSFLHRYKNAVVVPVYRQNQIIALLICYTSIKRFKLNTEIEDGLLIFKNFSQALLAQIERIEKIKNLSAEDELTGLYTRRYFIKELIMESLSCDRYGGKFCLAFFDMDNLKLLNDFYGHAVGDKAIKMIARIIKDNIRKTDVPARFGGDEFAVIFKNCSKEAIEDRIKNIKKLIEEESENQLPIKIKVSCGVAVYPDDTQSLDELLKIADMRMYEEKLKNKGEIK